MKPSVLNPVLKPFLDRLFSEYHRTEFLSSDPLEFVHRYRDPWDQEVVALLAAVTAYGNVKQIRASITELLRRIQLGGASPAGFIRNGRAGRTASDGFVLPLRGFVHRFNLGEDFAILLALIGESWKRHGSVGGHFLSYLSPTDLDIGPALSRLMRDWSGWVPEVSRELGVEGRTFSYLLTAPVDGSCCKRWCMLLRWFGRKDELDLGLWSRGSPLETTFPRAKSLQASQLVIPLDTHTGRISQYLGLTSRKSLNWKASLDVTAALRECDASDPVRYDFALSRLGILDHCQKKYRAEVCRKCQLLPVCRFGLQKKSSETKKS